MSLNVQPPSEPIVLAEMSDHDCARYPARALAVKGGIGDFLQYLPFMQANPQCRYLVASHHECVPEFFAAFGIQVEEMSLGRLARTEVCPRRRFFDSNPFPSLDEPIFTDGPVLGVHLGGSDYSLSVEKRFGFPSKALPLSVLTNLMAGNSRHNFILFGSRHEMVELLAQLSPDRIPNIERLKFVCADKVTDSLSRVAECSAVVGSDSAFKTMSAMLGIPTVVWVGDYMDSFRDENFIDPYVEAGIMSVYRYTDLTRDSQVVAGVRFCLDRLRSMTG